MLESQRKKAAQLGANAIVLGDTKEPNASTKILASLVGAGAERKGNALAIYIPSDTTRVRGACSNTGGGSNVVAEEAVQPQTFGQAFSQAAAQPSTPARMAEPPSTPPVQPEPQPARVQPVVAQAPAPTPAPAARATTVTYATPAPPAAPDNSHLDLWKNIPPGTRWIADMQKKQYYQVHCGTAVAIPEHLRFYYQTEGAAQADGYTPGDC